MAKFLVHECIEERFHDEFFCMSGGKVPPHDLPGVEIHECSKIHKLFFERKIRKISHPCMIRSDGTLGSDEISKWCRSPPLISSFSPSPHPLVRLDTKDFHDTPYPFLSDLQRKGNPSVSITGIGCKDRKNLFPEKLVCCVPMRMVVPGGTDKPKNRRHNHGGKTG